MLIALAAIAVAGYAGIALSVAVAIARHRHEAPHLGDDFPTISVVVAARNEERSIETCMNALLDQDYPAHCVEIIVVDDESTDRTLATINKIASRDARIRVLSTRGSTSLLTGKARPLDIGINAADSELIATTDADCCPPPSWLSALAAMFMDSGIDLACGCTVVEGSSAPAILQRLDWMHLMAVAAGLNLMKRPLTAMGNNMMFRRRTYLDLGGFAGMGDSVTEDFRFYRAVCQERPDGVVIIPDSTAVNHTDGEAGLSSLLQQKTRWLAGGLEAPVWVWALFLTFFLAHVGLLTLLFVKPLIAGFLFLLKAVSDMLMIRSLGNRLSTQIPWRWFVPFQIYQVAYSLLVPAMLLAKRRIVWRGRTHAVIPYPSSTS